MAFGNKIGLFTDFNGFISLEDPPPIHPSQTKRVDSSSLSLSSSPTPTPLHAPSTPSLSPSPLAHGGDYLDTTENLCCDAASKGAGDSAGAQEAVAAQVSEDDNKGSKEIGGTQRNHVDSKDHSNESSVPLSRLTSSSASSVSLSTSSLRSGVALEAVEVTKGLDDTALQNNSISEDSRTRDIDGNHLGRDTTIQIQSQGEDNINNEENEKENNITFFNNITIMPSSSSSSSSSASPAYDQPPEDFFFRQVQGISKLPCGVSAVRDHIQYV